MTSSTFSSQEFNFNKAARAADEGPVFIAERSENAYILMKLPDYQRLIREHRNMARLLSVPDLAASIEFDPPRSQEKPVGADFS